MRVATPIEPLRSERLAALREAAESVQVALYIRTLETAVDENMCDIRSAVDLALRVLAQEMRLYQDKLEALALLFKVARHLPLIIEALVEPWQVARAVEYGNSRLSVTLGLLADRGVTSAHFV